MEEDKQHLHPVRKETETNYSDEEVLLSHNTHTGSKGPTHKSESSVGEHKEHHHHQHHSAQAKTNATLTEVTATSSTIPAMTNYNVNVQFDPATPQAAKPNQLTFMVTEQKIGESIKQFDIIHDKLMHLIIVKSEDLSHFAHIHPKLNKETGIFHIVHTFAKAGKYKMWVDVKPKGGMQILTAFPFNVEGQPVHSPVNITSDKTFLREVVIDGRRYQISLSCQPEHLVAGTNIRITFKISDANGKPISNLEPLMAAGGHCVIIDADAREFLHVHPAEEIHDASNWRGGPSVSFLASFPNPGLYRAWGQFQHEGKLLTADFTFDIGAG
jgi:hypothetical protein